MTYLISAYAKDDNLYPKDIKIRALIDQRLQFDLGTLYQRMGDYFVIICKIFNYLIYVFNLYIVYTIVCYNVNGCTT